MIHASFYLFLPYLAMEHFPFGLLSQFLLQQLDQYIFDSTRTKIHQSLFSQIWSPHICRLRSQMPHFAWIGKFIFSFSLLFEEEYLKKILCFLSVWAVNVTLCNTLTKKFTDVKIKFSGFVAKLSSVLLHIRHCFTCHGYFAAVWTRKLGSVSLET